MFAVLSPGSLVRCGVISFCVSVLVVRLDLTNPHKPSVVVRFRVEELDELNRLVHAYGIVPRSSIVNIAIEQFLPAATRKDFEMCRKPKVNLLIDRHLLDQLSEKARTYGVHRTDLIKLAIRRFTLKYGLGKSTVQRERSETGLCPLPAKET